MDKPKPRIYFIGVTGEFRRFESLNPGIVWVHIYENHHNNLSILRDSTLIVGDSGRRLLYDNPQFGDVVNRAQKDNIIIYL